MTIEERVADVSISLGYAKLYCDETKPCLVKKGDAIRVATEQDRIARQEERERCKENLLDWVCRCYCTGENYKKCGITDCKHSIFLGIRKIMEGGEQ